MPDAAPHILLRRARFCLSAKQSLEFLASKLAKFAGREAGDTLEGGAEVAVAGEARIDHFVGAFFCPSTFPKILSSSLTRRGLILVSCSRCFTRNSV